MSIVGGGRREEVAAKDLLPLVLLFLSALALAFRDYGKGDDDGLATTASSLSSSTLVSAIRQEAFLCF